MISHCCLGGCRGWGWGDTDSTIHKKILYQFFLSEIQGDYRRDWLRAKVTDAKWRQNCRVKIILLLVNLWAQVRSQCFSAKAVLKYYSMTS
jgi:hypothetical protein